MKYLTFILIIAITIGCRYRKNNELRDLQQSQISAESPDNYDTLVLNNNIAVLWWPDSVDQVIMKASYDKISYNKFVDDMTWYTQKAIEFFDSLNIDNRITDIDVIVFKRSEGQGIVLNRKEIDGNMVLFHAEKEPLILSIDDFNRKEIVSFYR